MSIRKRFNETFGLEDSADDERKRFVQRVNQFIFHVIDTEESREFGYDTLFQMVCFELGVNAHDFRQRTRRELLYGDFDASATIRTLTSDDFTKTLRVLCILYSYFESGSDAERGQEWLSNNIKLILSRCTCDIDVTWKDGSFFPAGAEELDKPLMEETLTWLNDYPNERKNYQGALQFYLAGEPLPDVITNCYSAVEGVVRAVLGNGRTLDKNKDELLSRIDLSDGWKSMLATYIKYAHDYRHAFKERHEIKKQEAEAYLYMTGLIIRLVIESKADQR